MNDDHDLSITTVTIPFEYEGKKYVLKEASGDAACRWRNSILKATKMTPDMKVQSIELGQLADVEPQLVSDCVFLVKEDGAHMPVTLKTVRTWPTRLITRLFEKAKEISGLDKVESEAPTQEETEEELKNSVASTMDG